MSDLLRWFGERSETVQLGILTLIGGISASFWAAVSAWKKPVLAAPTEPKTAIAAPRAADDPMLLVLSELSATNLALAEILHAIKAQEPAQNARISEVIETIDKLTAEMYLLRNVMNNRGIGM